jgi:hypothetical protein
MPASRRAPFSITVAVCAAGLGGVSCNFVLGINEPEEIPSPPVRYYPWDGNTWDGAPLDDAGDVSVDASPIDASPDNHSGVADSFLDRSDAPASSDVASERPRCFRTADGGSCGFGCATLCGVRSVCIVDADCETKRCFGGRCTLPTCLDGALDGDEADIDCGGSCEPCGSGRRCRSAIDCLLALCVNGMCRPPLDASSDVPRSADATSMADARHDVDGAMGTTDVISGADAASDVLKTHATMSTQFGTDTVHAIEAE